MFWLAPNLSFPELVLVRMYTPDVWRLFSLSPKETTATNPKQPFFLA
jgi:hypothetical protein